MFMMRKQACTISKAVIMTHSQADFLNADVGTPLSTNMFAYCENNAINNVDYSGNSPKSKNIISNSYSGSTKNGF